MAALATLARDHPMLASVDALLEGCGVSLADLRDTRQLQVVGPADGKSYFVTFFAAEFQRLGRRDSDPGQ
jgi:polynucleotide 5'-kinase involved in rRNA processing